MTLKAWGRDGERKVAMSLAIYAYTLSNIEEDNWQGINEYVPCEIRFKGIRFDFPFF